MGKCSVCGGGFIADEPTVCYECGNHDWNLPKRRHKSTTSDISSRGWKRCEECGHPMRMYDVASPRCGKCAKGDTTPACPTPPAFAEPDAETLSQRGLTSLTRISLAFAAPDVKLGITPARLGELPVAAMFATDGDNMELLGLAITDEIRFWLTDQKGNSLVQCEEQG